MVLDFATEFVFVFVGVSGLTRFVYFFFFFASKDSNQVSSIKRRENKKQNGFTINEMKSLVEWIKDKRTPTHAILCCGRVFFHSSQITAQFLDLKRDHSRISVLAFDLFGRHFFSTLSFLSLSIDNLWYLFGPLFFLVF